MTEVAFGPWLVEMRAAIRGEGESDVPCGTCNACCRASHFVHVEPDEVEALARIPKALRFPAPRRAPGTVVLPFDQRGHCPMLKSDRCTIYAHRPRACRAYDCRVFAAAGVEPAGDVGVAVRRWTFVHATDEDRERHEAVRAAAAALAELLPEAGPRVAVLAIELHEAFLGGRRPSPEELRASIGG